MNGKMTLKGRSANIDFYWADLHDYTACVYIFSCQVFQCLFQLILPVCILCSWFINFLFGKHYILLLENRTLTWKTLKCFIEEPRSVIISCEFVTVRDLFKHSLYSLLSKIKCFD